LNDPFKKLADQSSSGVQIHQGFNRKALLLNILNKPLKISSSASQLNLFTYFCHYSI